MSVLKYKEMIFDSFEELLEVMKKDGIVKEEDDWQAQLKVYDPPEFLRMALKYSREMPPDLTQASEKMWLSVVYTIKLYFLKLDILLSSHRSLAFFYDMAAEKMSDVKLMRRLDRAWRTAERLHSFAYGTPAFRIVHFEEIHEEIKFFVEQFPKINSSEINEETMQIPSVQLHITPAPEQPADSDEEPVYASEAERRMEQEDDVDGDNMSTDSMIIHDSPDEINHMTSSVYEERNASPSEHELNYEAQKSSQEVHTSDEEEEEDKASVRAASPQHKVHDEEWTQGNEHVKVHSEEITDNTNGHYISQTVTRVTTTINNSEHDETNNNDGKDGNESTGPTVHMDNLDDDENNVSSL